MENFVISSVGYLSISKITFLFEFYNLLIYIFSPLIVEKYRLFASFEKENTF
jgi:hypothetical protein